MDIDTLKGKTLDDTTHAALISYVQGLATRAETAEGKAREAAKESITGRKTLKAERDAAFAALGVDTLEELEALPSPKGRADAAAQLEAQVRKLTRERDEALAASTKAATELVGERKQRLLASAIAKHPFVDADDARALVEARVRQEGGEFLFEAADGKLIPVDDGVAWLAKTKTHLVRASGAGGGSGYEGGAGRDAARNPYAKTTFNLTEQLAMQRENPALAASLKAAAQTQTA